MDSLVMRNPLYSVSRESYGNHSVGASVSEEGHVGISDPGIEPEPSGRAVVGSYTLWRGRMVYEQARDTQLAKMPLGMGNVLAVVSDVKIGQSNSSLVNYYTADVVEMSDYEPAPDPRIGWMLLAKRHWVSGEGYRFGFQAQEGDDEWSGEGNMLAFKYRVHDARLGRWLSLDPLGYKQPALTPYVSVNNMPIIAIDPDGRDIWVAVRQPMTGDVKQTGHMTTYVTKYQEVQLLVEGSNDPVTFYKKTTDVYRIENLPDNGKTTQFAVVSMEKAMEDFPLTVVYSIPNKEVGLKGESPKRLNPNIESEGEYFTYEQIENELAVKNKGESLNQLSEKQNPFTHGDPLNKIDQNDCSSLTVELLKLARVVPENSDFGITKISYHGKTLKVATPNEIAKDLEDLKFKFNVVMDAWYKDVTRENAKLHSEAQAKRRYEE